MCGICGKVSYGDERVDHALIRSMSRAIGHRGPDDEGVYIANGSADRIGKPHIGMGHQRLSVIDLSPSGRQPMCNENGTVWVVFNGEIYNFTDLRTELQKCGHRFKSRSDTEVIVHLYEQEGTEAVERIDGMFAFALWDTSRKRLWLCRDRVGIKPLVYYWNGSFIGFASEIKSLLRDPDIPREIDFLALELYLAFSYVPAPRSIFKGIRKLEPGHSLVLESGRISLSRYWDAPRQPDPTLPKSPSHPGFSALKGRLRQSLTEAVSAHLVSDVPLGAFLSGGVDSSIIVALMAQLSSEKVATFSIGFPELPLFDETAYAGALARHYGTDHHQISLSAHEMIQVLPEVLAQMDEPFADSSAIPSFIVSRETRRHVTVALSGDGGDELFAGYRSYLAPYLFSRWPALVRLLTTPQVHSWVSTLPDARDFRLLELFRRLKKLTLAAGVGFSQSALTLRAVFSKSLRDEIFLNGFIRNHRAAQEDVAGLFLFSLLDAYRGDDLNRILFADLKDSLPGDMLTKVDWMSMANALEIRVPFLDHRVVELAGVMSSNLKIHRLQSKFILKEAFADLLPPWLRRRPKSGFEVPIARWLRSDLGFLINRYLNRSRLQKQGIFESATVEKIIGRHLDKRADTSWQLWNLIVFQHWYDRYYDPAPTP